MPSMSERIGADYTRQFGKPATADNPEYQAYIQTALPQMIADDHAAYEQSKNRHLRFGTIATLAAAAPFAAVAAPAIFGGGAAAAGGGSAAAGSAATGAAMTGGTQLGIAQLLSGVFSNLWGAHQQNSAMNKATTANINSQNHAADLEYKAITEALNYQKGIDARDYSDWLNREARDRTDWENAELRKAPRRALADSAVRTLADYIRVPGMRPPQEIPVQRWVAPQQPVSTTMPVGGGRTLLDLTYGR